MNNRGCVGKSMVDSDTKSELVWQAVNFATGQLTKREKNGSCGCGGDSGGGGDSCIV